MALAGIALVACALQPAAAAAQAPGVRADYDWAVRPLGGEPLTLERFRGEFLFISLWASWCRPWVA